MNKYFICEVIPKSDGTQVFAVNKIIGDIFGAPLVEQIYKGSEQDCQKYLKEISEDGGTNEK